MYGVGKFYLQLLLLINIFNSNVVFFSFEFEFESDETFVMDSIGVPL